MLCNIDVHRQLFIFQKKKKNVKLFLKKWSSNRTQTDDFQSKNRAAIVCKMSIQNAKEFFFGNDLNFM